MTDETAQSDAKNTSPSPLKSKKVLLPAIFLLVVVLIGGVFLLTKSDDTDQALDTKGYEFLTMTACLDHFKDLGWSINDANNTCMRLEKELKSNAASSTNFEPFPLDCQNAPEDQWYRTDDTFVVDHKDPDTMYVNVERKGFYKTTDGGKTWKLKTKGIVVDHKDNKTGEPCYGEYPAAIMDPTNNKRILLATSGGGGGTINDLNMRGGGVYETTNGGESWKQTINDTMNGYTTHALVFDPKNPKSFYYGTASAPASYTEADPDKIWVTKGLIYKTPDNGKTWEELPTGFIKNTRLSAIMIDPRDTKIITAATINIDRNAEGPNTITNNQMGIIQTTDGGKTWARIDNLPEGHEAGFAMKMSPENPDKMYFISATNGSTRSKNFHSEDGGKSWKESSLPMDVFAYAYDGTLYGHQWQVQGPDVKVMYKSTDNGQNWTQFGTLPSEIDSFSNKKTRIQRIAFHPTDSDTLFLTGANGFVWKSTDSGSTWTTLLSLEKLNK